MGKLRPIGSEKLEGLDKINRILEIAKYNEKIPNPINENSSIEYAKKLADGKKYHIIKEKSGYVIKSGLNESTLDYIEPMKSRKYYPSYSQALKRLNLIVKEVNTLTGRKENLSLFNEGDSNKYYLKYSETNEQAMPPASGPTQPPPPAPSMPPPPAPSTPPPGPESSGPEPDIEMEDMSTMPDMEEPKDEVVSMKTIQKLTGKLTQKIRSFLSNEENEMTSKDIKYVINSVLSAFDLNDLDDEDKEEILGKFEEEDMDDSEGGEDPMAQTPEPPMEPEGEMAEYYPSHRRGARTSESGYGNKFETIFSESKVDSILNKYFGSGNINERQRKVENKLVKKYPNAKFIGESITKNLIYEINKRRVFIKPDGTVI
jgi:hypothetical protein